MEPKKMYIDGEWVTGSMEKPFDVINPATGEVLAQVYESSSDPVPDDSCQLPVGWLPDCHS